MKGGRGELDCEEVGWAGRRRRRMEALVLLAIYVLLCL